LFRHAAYIWNKNEAVIKLNKFEHKLLSLVMGLLLIAAMLIWSREAARSVTGNEVKVQNNKYRVVIDAGHGGDDPGKVGINGALEKDINLQIALLVQEFLEEQDVEVILTRQTDAGLYDAGASNKKVQDMKRRISIIEEAEPDVTVSIHQNSYPEEYVHGAQVFFYTGSKAGQALAQTIQEQFLEKADPENTRQIKANDSYYLLKKTGIPIVIVECGFLSNAAEAAKLCDEAYQERVAWAIHMGILQYLSENV